MRLGANVLLYWHPLSSSRPTTSQHCKSLSVSASQQRFSGERQYLETCKADDDRDLTGAYRAISLATLLSSACGHACSSHTIQRLTCAGGTVVPGKNKLRVDNHKSTAIVAQHACDNSCSCALLVNSIITTGLVRIQVPHFDGCKIWNWIVDENRSRYVPRSLCG